MANGGRGYRVVSVCRRCVGVAGDLISEVLGERGQDPGPVRRHHVVVGGRNRGGQTNLKLHTGGDSALLLQAFENAPGFIAMSA